MQLSRRSIGCVPWQRKRRLKKDEMILTDWCVKMQQLKSCSLEKTAAWCFGCIWAVQQNQNPVTCYSAIHIRFLWCYTNFGWRIFQWTNGFATGLGMLFSTAPWVDLSVLGITHHCPDTTHPLGHLVRLAIKRSLCMCAPFPFLGFIWIAWICSLGGPGDNFYSYQVFVLLCGGPTCYYLCSTQYGYCKDSDAISILFLQIAFLH